MIKGNCNICLSYGTVVRDHDHSTGFIRGLLCNPCNGRIGTYEANLCRRVQHGGHMYRTWLNKYRAAIGRHLSSNTGQIYTVNGRAPKLRARLPKVKPLKTGSRRKVPLHGYYEDRESEQKDATRQLEEYRQRRSTWQHPRKRAK